MSDKPTGNRSFWTGCTLLVHFIVAAAFLGVLVWIVPRFVEVFRDFEVHLSSGSILLINLSNLAVRYWYLLLSMFVCLDVAVVLGLSRLPARYAIVWSLLLFLAAVALALFIVLWGLLPFLNVVQQLSIA